MTSVQVPPPLLPPSSLDRSRLRLWLSGWRSPVTCASCTGQYRVATSAFLQRRGHGEKCRKTVSKQIMLGVGGYDWKRVNSVVLPGPVLTRYAAVPNPVSTISPANGSNPWLWVVLQVLGTHDYMRSWASIGQREGHVSLISKVQQIMHADTGIGTNILLFRITYKILSCVLTQANTLTWPA
jgi:hypothetical protein